MHQPKRQIRQRVAPTAEPPMLRLILFMDGRSPQTRPPRVCDGVTPRCNARSHGLQVIRSARQRRSTPNPRPSQPAAAGATGVRGEGPAPRLAPPFVDKREHTSHRSARPLRTKPGSTTRLSSRLRFPRVSAARAFGHAAGLRPGSAFEPGEPRFSGARSVALRARKALETPMF